MHELLVCRARDTKLWFVLTSWLILWSQAETIIQDFSFGSIELKIHSPNFKNDSCVLGIQFWRPSSQALSWDGWTLGTYTSMLYLLGTSIFHSRFWRPTQVNKTTSSEPRFYIFFSFLLQPTRKNWILQIHSGFHYTMEVLGGETGGKMNYRWHLPSVLLVALAALGERNFDAVHTFPHLLRCEITIEVSLDMREHGCLLHHLSGILIASYACAMLSSF